MIVDVSFQKLEDSRAEFRRLSIQRKKRNFKIVCDITTEKENGDIRICHSKDQGMRERKKSKAKEMKRTKITPKSLFLFEDLELSSCSLAQQLPHGV